MPSARGISGRLKIVVIGGSGLIGTKLVKLLQHKGHEVLAASPSTGVNTVTGEGLAKAMIGADAVIDVSNSPSSAPRDVLEFFGTSCRNLIAAEAQAKVGHHVVLSVVGTDRLQASGYFRGKLEQENLIQAAPLSYTILRSTQFFEFARSIAQSSTEGETVRLASVMMQPVASDDVASALAAIALAGPQNEIVEVAGPDLISQDEFVRQYLKATGDPRKVVTDPKAFYFGTAVTDRSLTPGDRPLFGTTRFADWLKHAAPKNGARMATSTAFRP